MALATQSSVEYGGIFEGEFNETDMRPGMFGIGHALSKIVSEHPMLRGQLLIDSTGLGTEAKLHFCRIAQSYEEDCEFNKGITGGRLFDTIAACRAAGVTPRPVAHVSLLVRHDGGEISLLSGANASRATWVLRKTGYTGVIAPLRKWTESQFKNKTGKLLQDQIVTISLKTVQGETPFYMPEVKDISPTPEEDLEAVYQYGEIPSAA